MNEKYKKIIVSIVFTLLVVCILIQSIADNYVIRRANNAVDNLERELGDAQTRLAEYRGEIRECRTTVDGCRESVTRIAERLDGQSGELKDIISNLKQVRTEIENMENALNKFYVKYGDSVDDFNNTGGE